MGPSSDKNKKSRVVEPEPRTIEKIVEVEVEKLVEKEVPVYIEKTVENPAEKIIHKSDPRIDELQPIVVNMGSRISDLENAMKEPKPDCSEANEELDRRLQAIEQAIDIHDRTIVHIRELQASKEEMYKTMCSKMERTEKYNKYCMIGIVISITLSLIATII